MNYRNTIFFTFVALCIGYAPTTRAMLSKELTPEKALQRKIALDLLLQNERAIAQLKQEIAKQEELAQKQEQELLAEKEAIEKELELNKKESEDGQ